MRRVRGIPQAPMPIVGYSQDTNRGLSGPLAPSQGATQSELTVKLGNAGVVGGVQVRALNSTGRVPSSDVCPHRRGGTS